MPEFDPALRRSVRSRADGICEYCRISERHTLAEHETDHIIAIKHGGQTVAENLALCCTLCNRYKGSDIASVDPETGAITPLFHPRFDQWRDPSKSVRAKSSACLRKDGPPPGYFA